MPLAAARPTERTLTVEAANMHRRSFLTGIATSLLAGTAAPRLIPFEFSTASAFTLRTTIPAGEVYGRSPAMDALQGMLEILEQNPEMTAGQMIEANRAYSSLLHRTP